MDADPLRHAAICEIAKRELLIETLDRRMSDRLDFHDLAVWTIEAALTAAYEAGREAGRNAERRRRTPTRCECPACGRRIEIRTIPPTT
jgi:hypothetical protein